MDQVQGIGNHARSAARWRRLVILLGFAFSGVLALWLLLSPWTETVSAEELRFDVMEATIPELQAALAAGQVTSRELVDMYLARIAAYDQQGPNLNAISVINPGARATAEALDAERKAKGPRSPLHGIPIIVKDNYDTADLQTAGGSRSLAEWIPPKDAVQVTRLRDAGAIIIAKSNMHEFAYGWETIGSLFGVTRNPYALTRNPGGSSGGTGAAVAANFAAVGMGSDTCGSIRVPASFNNLVGLRGTQGISSRTGILPLSHTQDIGGPLARTVTDLALVLDATVGYDPADPQTAEAVGNIPRSYTAFLDLNGLQGTRLGTVTNFFGTVQDATVVAVFRTALDQMRARGAEVVDVTIPNWPTLFKDPLEPYFVLSQEFKFDLNTYLAERPTAPVRSLEEVLASGKFSTHETVEPRLRNSQSVATLDTKEYHEHLARRTTIKRAILQAMADHRLDALVYPTVTEKAPVLNELQKAESITCYLSANSGLPAITVPGGFTDDGFPVGVELLGRPWTEPTLIKLAYAYEQATRHRRPPASTPPLISSRQ
jgi:Asp-tRNA(Asn)/Glu-tRNA(Gln) amidotransferase A subunit family amidase